MRMGCRPSPENGNRADQPVGSGNFRPGRRGQDEHAARVSALLQILRGIPDKRFGKRDENDQIRILGKRDAKISRIPRGKFGKFQITAQTIRGFGRRQPNAFGFLAITDSESGGEITPTASPPSKTRTRFTFSKKARSSNREPTPTSSPARANTRSCAGDRFLRRRRESVSDRRSPNF